MRLGDLAHRAVAAHADELIVRAANGVVVKAIARELALGTEITSVVASIALEFLAHAKRHIGHVRIKRPTLATVCTVRNGTIIHETIAISIYKTNNNNDNNNRQQQQE